MERIHMNMTVQLRDATLVEKVVLLGCICRSVEDRTPARADEIRSAINDRLDDLTGRLSEADVCRSLNELAVSDLLEARTPDERSPAGKGRPTYELRVDVDAVLTTLAADENLEPLVEEVDRMRA